MNKKFYQEKTHGDRRCCLSEKVSEGLGLWPGPDLQITELVSRVRMDLANYSIDQLNFAIRRSNFATPVLPIFDAEKILLNF